MAIQTNSPQVGSRPATPHQGVPRQAPHRQGADPSHPEIDSSIHLARQSFTAEQVEAALRVLPSHGWTGGWTGRRDRALLVLSQMAGLSYANIAELTVSNVTIAAGLATIKTPGGTTTLRMTDDDLICGPCALARWLRALDMTAIYPTGRVIAAVIARAAPLTADSPHLCQGTVTVTEATRSMSLLTALNQPVPAATPARTPRSLTLPATTPIGRPSIKTASTKPASTKTASGKFPAQRAASGRANGTIGLPKSDYARADREQGVTVPDRLADGLESRARQLLEHRMSDVAGY